MLKRNVFSFFNSQFRATTRPEREQILCAMIRINYGTPWRGDNEKLKKFFPKWYHKNLTLGGLTQLIETLSPFSDEPTQSGIIAGSATVLEDSPTLKNSIKSTQSWGKQTTKLSNFTRTYKGIC